MAEEHNPTAMATSTTRSPPAPTVAALTQLASTIAAVQSCLEFPASSTERVLSAECQAFRHLLSAVLDLLHLLQQQVQRQPHKLLLQLPQPEASLLLMLGGPDPNLDNRSGGGFLLEGGRTVRSHDPLGLLQRATRDGRTVLGRCVTVGRDSAADLPVRRQTMLVGLQGPCDDVREALNRIRAVVVVAAPPSSFRGRTRASSNGGGGGGRARWPSLVRQIEEVFELADVLQARIRESRTQVEDALHSEVRAGLDTLAQSLADDALADLVGAVPGAADEHGPLQTQRGRLREDVRSTTKALYAEEVVRAVATATAAATASTSLVAGTNPSDATDPSSRNPSNPEQGTPDLDEYLSCPISLQVMRDPVILVASGQTYDRESLCRALLARPYRDPLTGARTLEASVPVYIPNYAVRALIGRLKGDQYYVPYDDAPFRAEYDPLAHRQLREVQELHRYMPEMYRQLEALSRQVHDLHDEFQGVFQSVARNLQGVVRSLQPPAQPAAAMPEPPPGPDPSLDR